MPVNANGVLNRRVDQLLFAVSRIAIEQFITLGVSRQSINLRPMVSSNIAHFDEDGPTGRHRGSVPPLWFAKALCSRPREPGAIDQGAYLISRTTGPNTPDPSTRGRHRALQVYRKTSLGSRSCLAGLRLWSPYSHSPMTQTIYRQFGSHRLPST